MLTWINQTLVLGWDVKVVEQKFVPAYMEKRVLPQDCAPYVD